MKLSICIVTMNRSHQLKTALESCLLCTLPRETEFIIIDNASTDNTEHTVRTTLDKSNFVYYYERLDANIGCGNGRNYAFSKSSGEYIYVLDDDAMIPQKEEDFFTRAISFFEENSAIATLTTQIFDTAWNKNRLTTKKRKFADELYLCQMFCGGSHFLRKSAFSEAPYLPNQYGYEELKPSLVVFDSGMVNVFCPALFIIHDPNVDKWDYSNEKNHELLIKSVSLPYAIKKMMFPAIFTPILYLAYLMRSRKHLKGIDNASKRSKRIIKETFEFYPINYRIKFKTAVKLIKNFGCSVF